MSNQGKKEVGIIPPTPFILFPEKESMNLLFHRFNSKTLEKYIELHPQLSLCCNTMSKIFHTCYFSIKKQTEMVNVSGITGPTQSIQFVPSQPFF